MTGNDMLKRILIAAIVSLFITTVVAGMFTVMIDFSADYDFRAVGAIVFMMLFAAVFLLFKPRATLDDDDPQHDDDEVSYRG